MYVVRLSVVTVAIVTWLPRRSGGSGGGDSTVRMRSGDTGRCPANGIVGCRCGPDTAAIYCDAYPGEAIPIFSTSRNMYNEVSYNSFTYMCVYNLFIYYAYLVIPIILYD